MVDLGPLRADRGVGRLVAMERVDSLHAQPEVQYRRRAVPQGRRLLRVPAAVLELRRQLDVRRGGHHLLGHCHHALPQRWYPQSHRQRQPAGDTSSQGAPLAVARRAGLDQGGRLLARPLSTHRLDPWFRQRCRVHRCQGTTARHQLVDGDLAVLVRAAHRQHLAAGLGLPGRHRGFVGARRHRRGHDLSRVHPAISRRPGRVTARAGLHRTQHPGDA